MSDRNYYVLCDDNCKFESMTKEQIFAAIAEATGNTPTSIDDAFISKIREQNKNDILKFWVGTQAEYNALEAVENNVFYIFTDGDDIEQIKVIADQTLEEAKKYTDDTVTKEIEAITSKINYGTAEPTGGKNGDIYIQIIE